MSSSSTGTSSPCKCYVEGEFVGSRPTSTRVTLYKNYNMWECNNAPQVLLFADTIRWVFFI